MGLCDGLVGACQSRSTAAADVYSGRVSVPGLRMMHQSLWALRGEKVVGCPREERLTTGVKQTLYLRACAQEKPPFALQ